MTDPLSIITGCPKEISELNPFSVSTHRSKLLCLYPFSSLAWHHAEVFPMLLTFVHFVVGHNGHTFLPDHLDIGTVAVTGPQEHGEEDGLGYGAPQHTQYHPAVGTVILQTGKAHHL